MIVEFFGVPGGGKTQILRQLVTSIPDAREALVTERFTIARSALSFALTHPLSFIVWMTELCFYANGLFRYKFGLLLRSMAARAEAENRNRSQLMFIDEGLLQRMLTIFDTPLTRRHITFLLKMTPLSDVVVIVRGGEFGRFVTAHNRLNSPRVKVGEKRFQEWMNNVRANALVVESLLPLYTRVAVCTQEQLSEDMIEVRRVIKQDLKGMH